MTTEHLTTYRLDFGFIRFLCRLAAVVCELIAVIFLIFHVAGVPSIMQPFGLTVLALLFWFLSGL